MSAVAPDQPARVCLSGAYVPLASFGWLVDVSNALVTAARTMELSATWLCRGQTASSGHDRHWLALKVESSFNFGLLKD